MTLRTVSWALALPATLLVGLAFLLAHDQSPHAASKETAKSCCKAKELGKSDAAGHHGPKECRRGRGPRCHKEASQKGHGRCGKEEGKKCQGRGEACEAKRGKKCQGNDGDKHACCKAKTEACKKGQEGKECHACKKEGRACKRKARGNCEKKGSGKCDKGESCEDCKDAKGKKKGGAGKAGKCEDCQKGAAERKRCDKCEGAAGAGSVKQLLIEPKDLKELLASPATNVRVLDVRPAEAYAAGHVPGAVRVDVSSWVTLARRPGGLQDKEAWAALVGGLGIARESTVVVYGSPLPYAARIWWILSYLGVQDVRLLNGGLEAWKAAGYELERTPAQPKPTTFEPQFRKELLATAEEVLAATRSGNAVILDVRSEGEYTGRVRRGKRAGHIPGAINLDWVHFVDEQGRIKPPAVLKDLFEKAGVDLTKPVITYCQSGARASVGVIAAKLAGAKEVRNYFGSWAEWSSREDLPIER